MAELARFCGIRWVSQMWPEHITRVVFVDGRLPHFGGACSSVEAMSEVLTSRGIRIEHLSFFPGTRPPRFPTTVVNRRERLHSGPIFRGHGSLLGRVWTLPVVAFKRIHGRYVMARYRRLVSTFGTDTVVVFVGVWAKLQLTRSGFSRRPSGPIFVGQFHSSFDSLNYEPWLRSALSAEFSDVDAITALSAEDAAQLQNLTGTPSYGIGNPLPSGIRVGGERQPLAIALVRLAWEKQLDLMIRAFAEATNATPGLEEWRLHIYGEGELRDALQTQIESLGVTSRVSLMGRTDDVGGVLRVASLNLLTSLYEGFGMSVLEAAAAGVPSVVFDCSPGLRWLVPPETGYLVPANDEDAYVRILRAAMADPVTRDGKAAAAVQQSQRFSADALADEFGRILGEIEAAKRSQRHAQGGPFAHKGRRAYRQR